MESSKTRLSARSLSVLIATALAIALGLLWVDTPQQALAADSGTWHGVSYDMDDDGNVTFHAGTMTGTFDNYDEDGLPDKATSVRTDGTVVLPADISEMFAESGNLTSVDMSGFDTSNVTRMDYMFEWCSKLVSVNLSGLDTSHVTTMTRMFDACWALESIDLSTFDASTVSTMTGLFHECTSLKTVNLKDLKTPNLTNMASMFAECSALRSIDLSGIDTSHVTNMDSLFYDCSSLRTLELSSLNTSHVTSMKNMFRNCSSLTSLDLSGFDTPNLADMTAIFYGCTGLSTLDLSGFDTSKTTSMDHPFNNCISLSTVKLGEGFSFRGVKTERQCWLPGDEWASSADGAMYAPDTIPDNVASTYTRVDSAMRAAQYAITALAANDSPTQADINSVKIAYAALSPAQKAFFSDYDQIMFTAQAKVDAAKKASEDQAAAKPVQTAVAALADNASPTQSDIDKVISAYASLTSNQQGLVTGYGNAVSSAQAKVDATTKKSEPVAISNATVTLAKASSAYTGKAQRGSVQSVKLDGTTLKAGSDYTVNAKSGTKVGSYTVTVTGKGGYTGTAKTAFKIVKAANTMSVKGKTATVEHSKLKKKAQTLKTSNTIVVTKAQGTVTYNLSSAKKGSKSFKSWFKLNATNGNLTVKKGLKKGTYKIKVKVTAAGNVNYNKDSKTTTVTIKVK